MPEKKPSQPSRTTRAYNSLRRQEQASITKDRIVAAAMHQLVAKGYADMTLESIASGAGVAPQTVYAVCGSKKGVLAAILENYVESNSYDKMRDSIPTKKNGRERVYAITEFLATLMRDQLPGFKLMRGLGVVSPELGDMETDYENMLYDKSLEQITSMYNDGLLRKGLDPGTATDVYWATCSPSVHRRLTQIRSWTHAEFIDFYSQVLGFLLLDPADWWFEKAPMSWDAYGDKQKKS